MNFLQAQVDHACDHGQVDETPLSLLFVGIANLLDAIEEGMFVHEEADALLHALNDDLGCGLTTADLYDCVVYVRFRRTGTPAITIH